MADLKRFRKDNGITQVELARYLGIGQSFISDIETGRRPMPMLMLERIRANREWDASALDVEVQEYDTIAALQAENRALREENARCWRLIEKLTKSGK